MKETDKAWLAGIVDGEGSIYVGKHNGYYQPGFVVTMTHERTMRRVGRLLSRPLYTHVPKKPPTAKRYWSVRAWNQNAAAVLRILLPYLVTKRKQAILLIALTEIQRNSVKGKTSRPARQRTIYEKVKVLNA